MPSWEITFKYSIEGEDTAIVTAKTKIEAMKKFRAKFDHFNQEEVVPDSIFIEALDAEMWGSRKYSNSDDYEIL